MATKKSKENPYRWKNGSYHSRPENTGAGAPKPKPPAAKPPAAAPAPPPPAPAEPTRVDPFFNGDDLAAINDFSTRWSTDLANLDAMLADLSTDTEYQKGQTNKQAKEQSSAATDNMAARGLFRSSIKDAALYDIEAQRTLAQKFLDDKMNAATLNAGTQKTILAGSKQRFDEAMLKRQGENAAAINDEATRSWSELMAQWTQKYGGAAKPVTAPPTAAAPKPTNTATQTSPNTASGSGNASRPLVARMNPQGTKMRYRWPNGSWHDKPWQGV